MKNNLTDIPTTPNTSPITSLKKSCRIMGHKVLYVNGLVCGGMVQIDGWYMIADMVSKL